jgi:hypothetical protein
MHRPGRRQIGPQHDGHVRCSGRWGCIVPAPARTSIYRSLAHVCRPHDNMPSLSTTRGFSGRREGSNAMWHRLSPSNKPARPAGLSLICFSSSHPWEGGGGGKRAIVIWVSHWREGGANKLTAHRPWRLTAGSPMTGAPNVPLDQRMERLVLRSDHCQMRSEAAGSRDSDRRITGQGSHPCRDPISMSFGRMAQSATFWNEAPTGKGTSLTKHKCAHLL